MDAVLSLKCRVNSNTPSKLLDDSHSSLYSPEGLTALAAHLKPGGIFAMWSDDPPEETFLDDLRATFTSAETHIVSFENPLQGGESASTVYVCG